MKVVRIEAWRHRMRLREPYSTSNEDVEHADNLFVQVITDRGPPGFGCAAPAPLVTGETPIACRAALTGPVADALVGSDPWMRERALAPVRSLRETAPAALAAAEMALLDLLGRVVDQPVYRLLGGFRRSIATTITLGVLPVADSVERSVARVRQGFRALKLKGGTDVDLDIERVRRVREAVGPDIEIRFDANQGYTPTQALRFARAVRAEISVLEQPTAPGHLPDGSPVPLMADESLRHRRDALRLLQRADAVNVKLMKVGGIGEGRAITAIARAGGLDVMVGCMDEAALGISAGLHFALSDRGVTLADLDGHFDLEDDPTDGCVVLRDGRLHPAEAPGLGVRALAPR